MLPQSMARIFSSCESSWQMTFAAPPRLLNERGEIAFDQVEIVREIRAILTHLMEDRRGILRPESGGELAISGVAEQLAKQRRFRSSEETAAPADEVVEFVKGPVVDQERGVRGFVAEKVFSPLQIELRERLDIERNAVVVIEKRTLLVAAAEALVMAIVNAGTVISNLARSVQRGRAIGETALHIEHEQQLAVSQA
jgi:hypothetical protein